MTLSANAKTALAVAYATKGKNRGQLLARCPRSTTLAAAAWQGAMFACNPYQISIGAVLFFTREQQDVMNEVRAHFDTLPEAYRIMAQRDREALERLGVW